MKQVYSLSGIFRRWQPVATMMFIQDHAFKCNGQLHISDSQFMYNEDNPTHQSVYEDYDELSLYSDNVSAALEKYCKDES